MESKHHSASRWQHHPFRYFPYFTVSLSASSAEMQAEIVGRLNKAPADLAQNNTILIPANLGEFADVLSVWRNNKA